MLTSSLRTLTPLDWVCFRQLEPPGKTYVIGANADQNPVAPDVAAASVVIDLPRAFLLVARLVKTRQFVARGFELGHARVLCGSF